MKRESYKKFCKYVDHLHVLQESICEYIDERTFDVNMSFESITEILDDGKAFRECVGDEDDAIALLSRHDRSFTRSFALAINEGYVLEELSSSLLALLLKEDMNRDEWLSYRLNIISFMEELDSDKYKVAGDV